MAGPSLRPLSWPPGAPGRWLAWGLVALATLGGAGGGLAALVDSLRGDDRAHVAAELARLSGAVARLEAGQQDQARATAYLAGRLEPLSVAKGRAEEARARLDQPIPDVAGARAVLTGAP